jgi:hypothetical protein
MYEWVMDFRVGFARRYLISLGNYKKLPKKHSQYIINTSFSFIFVYKGCYHFILFYSQLQQPASPSSHDSQVILSFNQTNEFVIEKIGSKVYKHFLAHVIEKKSKLWGW